MVETPVRLGSRAVTWGHLLGIIASGTVMGVCFVLYVLVRFDRLEAQQRAYAVDHQEILKALGGIHDNLLLLGQQLVAQDQATKPRDGQEGHPP